jgi:predicted dehydrogenase
MRRVKAGIVGCGNISGVYFKNATERFKGVLDLVACADLDLSRAEAKAAEFGVARAMTPDALIADPEIELVINLTIPGAHFAVCKAALEAGKHVYVEKPFAVRREESLALVELARAKGLRLGVAPDTFLGGGHQTCRKIIDDGWIGEPVALQANMLSHGHESWHPAPEFYYKAGGGPMLDMGPYYLTALVNMIGPVRRVTGSARITFPERTITSQPLHGTKITVDVPTHLAGVLDFANGAVGTIVTSFDVWSAHVPAIEIYGTEGSLQVPDPNGFGGTVLLRPRRSSEWREIPLAFGYQDNSRGFGAADMARAIVSGRPHRVNDTLAYHVLDVMHGIVDASESGTHYVLHSTTERPAPLPLGLLDGQVAE